MAKIKNKFVAKDVVICHTKSFLTLTYGKEYVVKSIFGTACVWVLDDDGDLFCYPSSTFTKKKEFKKKESVQKKIELKKTKKNA